MLNYVFLIEKSAGLQKELKETEKWQFVRLFIRKIEFNPKTTIKWFSDPLKKHKGDVDLNYIPICNALVRMLITTNSETHVK